LLIHLIDLIHSFIHLIDLISTAFSLSRQGYSRHGCDQRLQPIGLSFQPISWILDLVMDHVPHLTMLVLMNLSPADPGIRFGRCDKLALRHTKLNRTREKQIKDPLRESLEYRNRRRPTSVVCMTERKPADQVVEAAELSLFPP
jgi:hypothetical protein